MNRKKIVAGNWKMNLTLVEANDLAVATLEQSANINGVEKIIFAPFPYLQMLSELANGRGDFKIGAQNCSEHSKGAYTGEVSSEMIQSLGSSYVLVGHSERRQYFSETKDQLIGKIKMALENKLSVVFCFGEVLSERKAGKHFETVEKQLREVLSHFPKEHTSSLALAYEPVWAIGTGETASPAQAQEMHAFVRKTLVSIFDEKIANAMPILYGGSCNAQNAQDLFSGADVDGGLIGGASLKAEDFCKIMQSFS